MQIIQARVSEETAQKLTAKARAQGHTVSSLLRWIVEQYVSEAAGEEG